MKKFKLLPIFILGSIALTGCGVVINPNSQEEPFVPFKGDASKLHDGLLKDESVPSLPVYSVNINQLRVIESINFLKVGEYYQTKIAYSPVNASAIELTYTSSNPSVASVNDTGYVTALSSGETIITVKDTFTNLSANVKIFVGETTTSANAKNIANNILSEQQRLKLGDITKLHIEESYDYKLTVGGRVLKSNNFVESMFISKEDAYFRIYDYDNTTKVENGGVESTYNEWVFVTNSSFVTFIYHTVGKVKNYMTIDVSSYMQYDDGRYEALLTILDNIFRGGRSIIEDQFDDALGADLLTSVGGGSNHATSGAGNLSFTLKQSGTDTISSDEESSLEIPAGTKCNISDILKMGYNNNYLAYKNINETLGYTLEGTSYKKNYDVSYEYDTKEFDIFIPDKKDFLQVFDLFSL